MAKALIASAILLLFGTGVAEGHRHHRKHHQHHHYARHVGSTSLAGVVAPLAGKVREIVGTCHSHIISAVRHTYVAGTHRISLHASGHAVDVAGNPGCIYRHLAGWTSRGGGYSRDYGAVHHVHVSFGGREAGLVFSHHGGGRRYAGWHRRHYARRHWYGWGG